MSRLTRTLVKNALALPGLMTPFFAFAASGYSVTNPLGQGATFCSLIQRLLNAAMILGVPVAVLLIVYVGFQFVFAQGSEEKLSHAKTNFLYTIIGIAVFFGAWVIAQIIIGTLNGLGVPGLSVCSV